MNEPTHLDLFSGIGGFSLAAQEAGFRTIGFCEIDKYCQKVLAKNFMADAESERCGGGSDVERQGQPSEQRSGIRSESCRHCEIHSNIFDLDGTQFRGVDLITGGFPCQPYSVAGKRRGSADDRAIWPQMFRVIGQARPAWVLGENVAGIIPMELDNVLSDLERIGYATRTFVIPACALDARHRRDRVWVVGRRIDESVYDSECRHGEERWIRHRTLQSEGREASNGFSHASEDTESRWLPEPDVGRVANGIPNRVDRLKGLGNAIVPQVAYEILREIRKYC